MLAVIGTNERKVSTIERQNASNVLTFGYSGDRSIHKIKASVTIGVSLV